MSFISAGDYARIRVHHRGGRGGGGGSARNLWSRADPSLGAIREAYHCLVRASHPGRVIAQGLPPECIALAIARVARISAAYDRLAKGRARLA